MTNRKWKSNGPNKKNGQETRKISTKQLNRTPKITRERRTKQNLKSVEETINIKAEINETETKKTTAKINETKSQFFTLDKFDLIDIYRASHPKAADYTFFSQHGTFFQDWPHAGPQVSLGKFKKIETILSIFSDHRKEIRNKLQRKDQKNWTWQINNMLLNHQWITGEIKEIYMKMYIHRNVYRSFIYNSKNCKSSKWPNTVVDS